MPPATACCLAAASWGGWEVQKLLSKAAVQLPRLTTLPPPAGPCFLDHNQRTGSCCNPTGEAQTTTA